MIKKQVGKKWLKKQFGKGEQNKFSGNLLKNFKKLVEFQKSWKNSNFWKFKKNWKNSKFLEKLKFFLKILRNLEVQNFWKISIILEFFKKFGNFKNLAKIWKFFKTSLKGQNYLEK